MKRRAFLGQTALGAIGMVAGAFPRGAVGDSDRAPETLVARARALAEQPYQSEMPRLPPPFDALTYDSYRAIRPRSGGAAELDIGGGFRADLLPPGWLFPTPVRVSLPGWPDRVDLDPDNFEFAPRYFPDGAPEGPFPGLGYSGLRIRYPLNSPDRLDDLIVLQGASYFRALARDVAYGLSARGLAIGTGGPEPEEFPVTREIEVFGTDDGQLHLGCLIDSPRAAAALFISLRPGSADAPSTVMRCKLHLFVREPVSEAGIAPLTSMFQHNDLGPARIDDFRPAVHDSAVLVMANGAGERLWRPLTNPAQLQMSAFQDSGPRWFGLLQTPDRFDAFRDAEGAYHRRPSAFVKPVGDWGNGAVSLLEIPTPNEYADNIVVFWRPDTPLQPGREYQFAYDLSWTQPGMMSMPDADLLPLVPVRSASGIDPMNTDSRLFVIDYAAAHGGHIPDLTGLGLQVSGEDGVEITGEALYKIEDAEQGKLRASFVLSPSQTVDQAELRVQLRSAAGDVAPVWLFRWTRSASGGP